MMKRYRLFSEIGVRDLKGFTIPTRPASANTDDTEVLSS